MPDTKEATEALVILRKHGVLSDKLAAMLPEDARAGFYHLTSMYSHRGDGIPTQFTYPQEVRDAAVALAISALRQQPTGDTLTAAEAMKERCAKVAMSIARPDGMGPTELRGHIAAAIRSLDTKDTT